MAPFACRHSRHVLRSNRCGHPIHPSGARWVCAGSALSVQANNTGHVGTDSAWTKSALGTFCKLNRALGSRGTTMNPAPLAAWARRRAHCTLCHCGCLTPWIRMTWRALARDPLCTGADADIAMRVGGAFCAGRHGGVLLVEVPQVIAADALGPAFLAPEISYRYANAGSMKHAHGVRQRAPIAVRAVQ